MATITGMTINRAYRFQIRPYETVELAIRLEGTIDEEEFPHEAHAHLSVMADSLLADQFYDLIIGSAKAWDKETPLRDADAMTRNLRTMSAYQHLLKFAPEIAEQVLTDAARIVTTRIEADEMRKVQMEAEALAKKQAALEELRARIAETNGDLAALEALEDDDYPGDDDDEDGYN